MVTKFQECPFHHDELRVFSIYRSLSPGNFFISFTNGVETCKAILIDTLYNHFAEYIAGCSTDWNPNFEQMKILLLMAVRVKETLSEDERKSLVESKKNLIEFGTYDFNEECKFTIVDGKYTFKRKAYKFIIDNKNKEIRIIHSKSESNII
jgi:hypothetical protein